MVAHDQIFQIRHEIKFWHHVTVMPNLIFISDKSNDDHNFHGLEIVDHCTAFLLYTLYSLSSIVCTLAMLRDKLSLYYQVPFKVGNEDVKTCSEEYIGLWN